MEEYLAWLNSDRRVRELHFKLSLFFAKVRGKFSYLRTTGLTELINFVKGLKDDELKFFLRLQDVQEENVCHLVFKTLVIPICDAAQLTKESKQELYLALELLQGVCLLHHPSKKVAADLNAIPLLQELLERDQPQIQVAALECLLAVLVDCDDHQQFFRDNKGIDKVTAILRQKKCKERRKVKMRRVPGVFNTIFCRWWCWRK